MESTMLKRVEYHAVAPGPHLVVFGRIHGNEHCGTDGMERLIKELDGGKLHLERGCVSLIPCCNPGARDKKRRFLQKNLNRVFKMHRKPKAYEEYLANTIIKIVGKPDFVLDLHSFHIGGRKAINFAVQADSSRAVARVVQRFPVKFCLNDWREIQAAYGRPESFSTIDHFKSIGVPSVGVECGQHDSAIAQQVAYDCIRETLAGLGICKYKRNAKNKAPTNVFFKYLRVYEKGGLFVKDWREFDDVKKGEPVGRLADGTIVPAPIEGKVIFPHPGALPGDEWFYIAQY